MIRIIQHTRKGIVPRMVEYVLCPDKYGFSGQRKDGLCHSNVYLTHLQYQELLDSQKDMYVGITRTKSDLTRYVTPENY